MTTRNDEGRLVRAPAAQRNTTANKSYDAFVSPQAEEPEHRNDRRRFLVWALMVGATKPERLTERIVAELREDGAV